MERAVELRERLRLIVITDERLARPRSVAEVVEACVDAGATAIQLRDKSEDDGSVLGLARTLRGICSARGALFLVNDRLDIAFSAGAHGVHLGPDDLPPDAARRAVRHLFARGGPNRPAPDGFLIGWSTDDPRAAADAASLGVDYIGCGSVFGTSTKREAAGERIGVEGLARVVEASPVPVVAVGGVTPDNAPEALRAGAAGVATVSAVMRAADPGAAVRAFLRAGRREGESAR